MTRFGEICMNQVTLQARITSGNTGLPTRSKTELFFTEWRVLFLKVIHACRVTRFRTNSTKFNLVTLQARITNGNTGSLTRSETELFLQNAGYRPLKVILVCRVTRFRTNSTKSGQIMIFPGNRCVERLHPSHRDVQRDDDQSFHADVPHGQKD